MFSMSTNDDKFYSIFFKQDDEDDNEEIEPIIQARFIRAVAQLQLLGFIQSSKRKTDHVARLTWGV
jgi:origin recognition complex subunit 3